MKILYITQWFEPEPAFKGQRFAKALTNKGDIVDVVTGYPNYPGGKLYEGYKIKHMHREIIDGICVTRLPLYPSHNKSSLGRVLNYISFFFTVLLYGLIKGRNYDAIYVYHPPITPAAAAAIFSWVHRKPLIVDIQDLWPDSVVASKMGGSIFERILTLVCNLVYKRAHHIICQSDGIVRRINNLGVPAEKISRQYNWSSYQSSLSFKDDIPARIEDTFNNKINIVYGGNLGEAQDLTIAIDAAIIAVETQPRLCLHLIGGGIEHSHLKKYITQRKADKYVLVHAAVNRETMDQVFDMSDALLIHLRDDPLFEITIPSKVQHYLSCGKPIIAGISGEAASILVRSKAALVTPSNNRIAMASSMTEVALMSAQERSKMGENGRSFYQQNMSFDDAISTTLEIINRVV